MLSINNYRWKEFNGGYRQPYDASKLITALETASQPTRKSILDQLFQELHHQGDVDLASYYSVPQLVRIAVEQNLIDSDILFIVTVITIQSHKNNPPIPDDLKQDYKNALKQLGELGKLAIKEDWDLSLATIALAAIAVSKGQIELASAIINLEDPGTLKEFLENY